MSMTISFTMAMSMEHGLCSVTLSQSISLTLWL